ncbi:sodium-dependent transporter [Archaeoglobus veneficus]|uniref:Transporter n=1 Tax=Archaeoglobus veneficus (strain DSM 11195 / SNP6) TaxID=693661 RepID=F2KQW2_ARCVS|nr:sodium-dependent transporter [Archaeoglobus veneficus]AEA47768.1 sodium:neurotransmitter symporter [Archaeoglobus veneficus SNP6]
MVREKWSSRIGFLLAGIGSAVGLGNVWRFPYIVGQNGGGAFLIPYLISVFLFGLPLMLLEFSTGRLFKGSVVSSLKKIRKKFKWIGIAVVSVLTVVLSYYLVITGWILAFFTFTLLGRETSFESFAQTYFSPLFFVVVTIAASLIVMRGVRKGIEKTSKIMVPALGVLLAVMVIYSLSLPNAMDGITFYLTPDLSKLSDSSIWAAAFGQAFFSLSVGSGILLTYGSYLEEKISLVNSSMLITIFDLLVSFMSGLIVFSIASSFGFEVAAGPKLAFSTLPQVFDKVPYGFFLEGIFFLLLFFAALTSAISMLEIGVAVLIDETSLDRFKSTSLLSSIILVLGFPAALSYSGISLQFTGRPVLDLMDETFGSFGIPLTALLLSTSISWFLDNLVIAEEINKNAKWKIGKTVVFLTRYFIPIVLLYVLLTRLHFYLV